jgi:ABC-2 type transport system permease protein
VNVIGVVFAAEFVRRVRSRTFLVGTVIGALSIAAIAFLPALLGNFAGAPKTLVLVGDPTLTSAAAKLLARDFTIAGTLPRLEAPPTIAYLDAHKKATAVAVLERTRRGLHVVTYTRDPGELRSALATDLAPLQIALATGIGPATIAAHTKVLVDEHDVSGRFTTASQAVAAKGIAYVFVMLLYLAILLNAQSIVMAVAEEKTSRIAELLVAMLDPAQLLFAKVLAATATGFVQLAVWIATAAVAGKAVAGVFAEGAAGTPALNGDAALGVTAPEILWFILFFVIGFVQCAVLFAAAGSLVNRAEDTSSVSGPLYIPIVGAIVIAQFALQFPNAPNVVTFSFVPLLAPFVMFTRVVVGSVPPWQLATSIALNVAAAIALAWAAGRVYRVGMLLYGRFPSPRQIVAALRQR